MKILHLSDTHGGEFWKTPIPDDVSLVVHTGDLILDMGYGTEDIKLETDYAKDYLKEIAPAVMAWLGGRKLVYIPGNHDFAELEEFVSSAVRIQTATTKINGVKFAGYAGIPPYQGKWNWELEDSIRKDKLAEALWEFPDVLVTHCGPAGILSTNQRGESHGCRIQASLLNGSGFGNVRAHLFGHMHCGPAMTEIAGITFSNAAGGHEDMTGNIVEIGSIQI